MKIGFDVDNVICNTTEEILNFINNKLPEANLKIEDIKSYWIEESLPQKDRWIVPLAFTMKEVWKKVKLIEGSVQAIERLYNEGHEIYFVTATTPENFRKKISFLKRNFPFLPASYIENNSISIKKKQLLDLDILVDDYLENLIGRRNYTSICFDYPWNQNYKDNGDTFRRAYNWTEVEKIIREISLYR